MNIPALGVKKGVSGRSAGWESQKETSGQMLVLTAYSAVLKIRVLC